jgi:hypothetical protein
MGVLNCFLNCCCAWRRDYGAMQVRRQRHVSGRTRYVTKELPIPSSRSLFGLLTESAGNSFKLPVSGKNRKRSKTILELDFLAVAIA